MRPACLKTGFGEKVPRVSIVTLYCDFGNPKLSDMAISNIKQIKRVAPLDSEIIVVANGISETLRKGLENIQVIVISTNINLGCVVKNLGYEVAQGEYIFSIDHDVFVRDTEAFSKCIDFLDNCPETAIVGPCGGNINFKHWSSTSWGVTEAENGKDIFGYENKVYFGDCDYLDGTSVDTIPSMFWCFRRSLLREVGMLDWAFGPFVGSDTDFCFRTKEIGYEVKIIRVPVEHVNKGGYSHKNQDYLEKIRLNHLALLYEKWHKSKHIFENYRYKENASKFKQFA